MSYSPSQSNSHLKEKINTAYSDLEILQSELKKLKNSAITMNNLNDKMDRSMDRNILRGKKEKTNKSIDITNNKTPNFPFSNSQAESLKSKFSEFK